MHESSKLSEIRLKTFCFAYPLRAGVIIAIFFLGFYYVVFALMMSFWLMWMAQWKTDSTDDSCGLSASDDSWYAAVVITFLFACMNTVTVILLIVAVTKKRHRCLITALVFLFIAIVINLFHLLQKISGLSRKAKVANPSDASEHFEVVIFDLMFCAFVCYLWAVILSYFMQETNDTNDTNDLNADPRPDVESPWVSSASGSAGSKTEKKRENEIGERKKDNRFDDEPSPKRSRKRIEETEDSDYPEPVFRVEKRKQTPKAKRETKSDDVSPVSGGSPSRKPSPAVGAKRAS